MTLTTNNFMQPYAIELMNVVHTWFALPAPLSDDAVSISEETSSIASNGEM